MEAVVGDDPAERRIEPWRGDWWPAQAGVMESLLEGDAGEHRSQRGPVFQCENQRFFTDNRIFNFAGSDSRSGALLTSWHFV